MAARGPGFGQPGTSPPGLVSFFFEALKRTVQRHAPVGLQTAAAQVSVPRCQAVFSVRDYGNSIFFLLAVFYLVFLLVL